jgi:glycosyltransferase involved in cell wall biosynthesis
MKILYLTQILSPSIGGGELLFFNLAKSMLKLGHEVHIICHRKKQVGNNEKPPPSSDIVTLVEMGATVHYVRPEQLDIAGVSSSGNLYNAFRMQVGYIINALRVGKSLVRNNGIDIIHANMYTPVIAATILGKICRIPVVITLHNPTLDIWKDWSLQQRAPRSAVILGPIYEKIILRMPVDIVHVVSNKVKMQLNRLNPGAKAVVIYNGIELAEDYLGSNLQVECSKFVIYIGRLVVGKNLQVLILAFKDVVKIVPEAKLLVIGDGPMRQPWQELVNNNNLSDNIHFLGHITDRNAKLELLSKCSAVVFPSTDEGFAMVPIEAFAMSKPLLISNVKPSDEIVEDSVDGFLLPPDDPAKWSEKIVYMLTHPQICEKMGKKGRNKVIQKFNMNVVSNKMEQLYKSLTVSSAKSA